MQHISSRIDTVKDSSNTLDYPIVMIDKERSLIALYTSKTNCVILHDSDSIYFVGEGMKVSDLADNEMTPFYGTFTITCE